MIAKLPYRNANFPFYLGWIFLLVVPWMLWCHLALMERRMASKIWMHVDEKIGRWWRERELIDSSVWSRRQLAGNSSSASSSYHFGKKWCQLPQNTLVKTYWWLNALSASCECGRLMVSKVVTKPAFHSLLHLPYAAAWSLAKRHMFDLTRDLEICSSGWLAASKQGQVVVAECWWSWWSTTGGGKPCPLPPYVAILPPEGHKIFGDIWDWFWWFTGGWVFFSLVLVVVVIHNEWWQALPIAT